MTYNLLKRAKAILASTAALALTFPLAIKAADSPINSVDDIIKVAENIATWTARLFWIAAVIATLYAGFLFLTAGGDTEKVTKAKRQIWYAVIAIVIGLMAFGLPTLINSIIKP
jgi:hypothetical protein